MPSFLDNHQVYSAQAVAIALVDLPVPTGVGVHWETEQRVVWNEQQHVSEERELVFEISWIAELGVWRCFLRSQRKHRPFEFCSRLLLARRCGRLSVRREVLLQASGDLA